MSSNGDPVEAVIETAASVYSEAQKQEVPKQAEANAPQADTKANKKLSFLEVVHETGLVAAKTVAGVGVGAAAGIGAVVAISIAEITLPTLLVVQIFSFAGGALGFMKGLSKK